MNLSKLLAGVKPHRNPLLVVAVIVIVFAVPPTRCLLAFQGHVVTEDLEKTPFPPLWIGGDQTSPRSASEAVYVADHRYGDTGGQSHWDMIRRYPKEAALYAGVLLDYIAADESLLSYSRLELRSQEERHRLSHERRARPARSEALTKALYAVSMGNRLEPNNSYYDLCHAYLLYGEGCDAEALAAIHRASLKTKYDSHYQDRLDAALAYGARLASPVDSLCPSWKIAVMDASNFAHAARFRSICKLAMGGQRRDDARALLETVDDLMRIGNVMRDCSDSFMETLVGESLQRTALYSSSLILRGQSPRWQNSVQPSDSGDKLEATTAGHYLSELRASAGERLPESWYRQWKVEADKTDRLYARMGRYADDELPVKWMAKPMVVTVASGKLFEAIFWVVFLWFVSWIWLAARRNLSRKGVGPSPVLLWLAILIPAAPAKHALSSGGFFRL